MTSEALHLKKEFIIEEIISLHYFEYKSDFIFKSEYHDYWKLLYVEDGCAEISFSGKKTAPIRLKKGELFVEAPNEYYSFKACDSTTPVVFNCGFYCGSEHLSLLKNKKFTCADSEKDLLLALAAEGKNSFSPKITSDSPGSLERKYNRPFGGEQLVGIYLEMLLISLMRQYTFNDKKQPSPAKKEAREEIPAAPALSADLLKTDSILFNRITEYYAEHITEHVKVEQICKEFSIGRSHLQRIFREQTGCGAIEYFCQMRISAAKRLIRENRMNLTDTAAALGYTSIYYFSKQFKKITGMSPSSYQKMVRTSKKDPLYAQIELDETPDR